MSLIHICIGFILAVGGGSVIDSAKAIAMGVPYDGDVWDFFATGKPIETALPVATILTLPATGSEASDGTVVTNEEAQLKLPYGDVILRPVFSIMNPELYFTLPENQVANGVCDMMSHIMERYFTNTTHTDVTDGLCESCLLYTSASQLHKGNARFPQGGGYPVVEAAFFDASPAVVEKNLFGVGLDQGANLGLGSLAERCV